MIQSAFTFIAMCPATVRVRVAPAFVTRDDEGVAFTGIGARSESRAR